MPEQISEQIRIGKQQGVKLYFCGLVHCHFSHKPVISLDDIITELKPDVVLLESRTPESTYQNGVSIGNFEDEVKYLALSNSVYWQSPNLREIKRVVDSLGCLVQGMDLPIEQKKSLERKYDLRNERARSIYESLLEITLDFLDERGDELSDYEYREMEKFRDEIESTNAGGRGENDINDVGSKYYQISSVVDKYPQLHKFIAEVTAQLQQLGNDVESYLKERESFISKAIINVYDGVSIILTAIGSGHIRDESYLLKSIRDEKIVFVKFHNYKA